MGWDEARSLYVMHSFENHGFYRRYDVTVDRNVSTISGGTERARIEFQSGGSRQIITWEGKPKAEWLPLCDRVATKQ